MKLRRTHEQRPLTSGQLCTMQIPTYKDTIQSLVLNFTKSDGTAASEAQVRAEIASVRFTMNSDVIVDCPIVQFLDMYELLGVKVQHPEAIGGTVELNIGRLMFNTPDVRNLFGLGTADISSAQIQITPGTLSAITAVQAYTERDPIEQNLGAYVSVQNSNVNFNATGKHSMDTLQKLANTTYLALAIHGGASGVISAAELRANSGTIREEAPTNVNKQFLSNARIEQPAGYYVHGLMEGSPNDGLDLYGVGDLRLLTTFTTAPGAGGYNITTIGLTKPVPVA